MTTRYEAKYNDSHEPRALPLDSVLLKIHAGSAKKAIAEAVPETICPSQMMKIPRSPRGRLKGKAQFDNDISRGE